MTIRNEERYQTALKLASRPNGMQCSDMEAMGFTRSQVGNVLERLLVGGEVFKAKLSYKTARYFTDKATAERVQLQAQKPTPAYTSIPGPRSKAPWPADAPVHYPRHPDGSPAYKVTVAAPSPTPLRSNTHTQT